MRFRPRFWAVLLCGLLGAGATASAETVTFTTSFAFNNPSGGAQTAATIGGATFTLVGATHTVSSSQSDISFGSLLFNGNTQSAVAGGMYNFTLTLTQSPVSGNGASATSSVDGVVSWINGLAKVDFAANAPITIGNFAYMPDDIKQSFQSDAGVATITGDVSAAGQQVAVAPVPAAVWGGVALCGLLAAFKLRRHSSAEI